MRTCRGAVHATRLAHADHRLPGLGVTVHETVPAPVGVVGLGEVHPQVHSPALFAQSRRRNDVLRNGQQVEELQLRHVQPGSRERRLQRGQRVGGLVEVVPRAHDAAQVDHHLSDGLPALGDRGRVVAFARLVGQIELDLAHRRVGDGQVAVEIAHGALPEDQALEQRVRRQAVGSVDAGAGGLSAGVEPGDGRAAPGVGEHTTDVVVRCGRHRDELRAEVEATLLKALVDGREPLLQEGAVEMAGVEPHVVGLVAVEDAPHVPHHHVARSQFGPRMRPDHETLAGPVEQVGALAAQRLGDQQGRVLLAVERRGMELHELHVAHHGARPVGHGVPVARRDQGVGGAREDLADAPAGEHDRPREAHGELAAARRERARRRSDRHP